MALLGQWHFSATWDNIPDIGARLQLLFRHNLADQTGTAGPGLAQAQAAPSVAAGAAMVCAHTDQLSFILCLQPLLFDIMEQQGVPFRRRTGLLSCATLAAAACEPLLLWRH